MNREELFEVIEDIDENHIKAAREPRKKARGPAWIKWGTAAACVCLIVAGVLLIPNGTEPKPDQSERPVLTLPELVFGGMGFEGWLYYDISERDTGSPWTPGQTPDTLPVFQNGSYNVHGLAVGLEKETMQARAEAAAEALGMEILDVEYNTVGGEFIGTDLDPDTVLAVKAVTENAAISVEADGTLTVRFGEGLVLPEGYCFTYHDTTDAEAEAVLDYLIEEYAALLGFSRPTKVLSWDRNIYGQMIRCYHAYDAAGDTEEDLLNYHFRYAQFAPDDDGELMLIRLYDGLACADKIGDYPIISEQEALTLLLEGHYATSVPYEMPGKEYVAKTELVYHSGSGEQMFLPYYRFLVELPEMEQDNGLKDYGAYYVPAVEGTYLANMPTYDGGFN